MDIRKYQTHDVLVASQRRIATVFDRFDRICVSFSGGKDSAVLLHLMAAEARRRQRRIGLLFIDLEAQYSHTITHVQEMFDRYEDVVDPYWVSLPLRLRNALSQFEPQWMCWDPDRRDDWVRSHPAHAISGEGHFPFFRRGMEFEEFVPAFNSWYAGGRRSAAVIGIRTDESLNRWRAVTGQAQRFEGHAWTTWKGEACYNAYPIYDWRTNDIWIYFGRTGLPYNRIYDRMHAAGLSIHQMRICQPYGDDQRRGLWLYHVLEPETWPKVISRVSGSNAGALYAQESGNILGNIRISKPPGHTWQSFAELMLSSMPPHAAEHYGNKIAGFINWWSDRGYPNGIPDVAEPRDEASKKAPSWRRVCKTLLKNDWWCKGLTFSQHKAEAYEKYLKVMKGRRAKWGY